MKPGVTADNTSSKAANSLLTITNNSNAIIINLYCVRMYTRVACVALYQSICH
jgi:hypothetical protein